MTTTAIPSLDVDDFKSNIQDFDRMANGAGTYTDRFGDERLTLDEFMRRNGFEAPVAFASGISVSRSTQTVTYNGDTYHAAPSAVPFTTTGTFNSAQWLLLRQNLEPQGIVLANKVITGFDATGLQNNAWVHFAGRDTIPDGGGGWVRFVSGSTDPADGGTVYEVVGGRLIREGWPTLGVDPRWYGIRGNGTANDTAAFALLEQSVTGKQVDLLGKTYLVDRQPTANDYFNGYFKRASDSHVFKAGRFNPAQANRGAEITLKAKAEDSRYSVPVGLNKAIVVLGDSISHGAFVGNSYHNGWVNILKRMLNAETGGKGYGFAPMLTIGSGATLTKEVHDVSVSGSWVGKESTTGGEDILQGLSFTSSTAGDYIQFSVPTFQQYVRLWYVEDVGAGTFSYAVNGGAATNVNTSAASRNVAKSVLIPMNDNGAGAFTVKLTVVSGSVTLCGISYETPPNAGDEKAGNVVHNFSQSGRRLKPATEGMIDLACRGSVLVLALGYNDHADCATDAAYNAAFQQRIDWIIQYCLKYNTTLVVADFCWWAAPSNPARQGLKRAATEARGIYVPLPDYLTRDQLLKTEYIDSYYMIDTLKMWADTAHPNAAGQKWMAETVAKAMGLSCTSKEQALALHDYPWPLQFDAASIFKNSFTQMPYLSHVKRNGDSLVFGIKAVTKTGAAIPAGAGNVLNKDLSVANSRQFSYYNASAVDGYMPINLNAAGAVSTGIQVGLANNINVASYNPYLSNIDYGFSLPLDVTVNKS